MKLQVWITKYALISGVLYIDNTLNSTINIDKDGNLSFCKLDGMSYFTN